MSIKGKQLRILESPIARLLPDRLFLKWKFRLMMGKSLNLDNPQTYNEKLQWLKLNCRDELFTRMADKALAKSVAAERIGKEYIIPTLGIWKKADDITPESLGSKCALKCTHDSGSCCIYTGGNLESCREKLSKSLKDKFFYYAREWPYKNIEPQIIAEEFIGDNPKDYKFFCFDGKPEFMFIASDRSRGDTRFDFYDMDFRHLPLTNGHPCADIPPERPEGFDLMAELAEKLSRGIKHVRVDFYQVGDRIYFGEYTFFHWGGFVPFNPPQWDYEFGKYLKL